MNQTRKNTALYFENISLVILGVFLFIFPLLFLSTTTDSFVLPKQIALTIAIALFTILFGLKTITEGKLKLQNSPFDVPILIFLVINFLSALFSVNRFDSLIAFVPLLFVGILYFAIVNLVRGQKQLLFLLGAIVAGATLSGLLTILSFFKIYPLPFTYTQVPFFSTFGSLLDQATYMALVLPITGYFMYSLLSSMLSGKHTNSPFEAESRGHKRTNGGMVAFTFSFLVIATALGITVFMLLTSQKPLILPFEIGLQTGFGAISQDAGNVLKSFLLGSGVGTYLIDFTRFKPAIYNLTENLWAFTFFRSSSYILELLATTGVLGVASFFFLVFRVIKERYFFLPVFLALIAAFILPFSFTLVTLLFVLLAVFAVVRIHSNPEKYADIEFYLVAFKKGLFVARPEGERMSQNDREKKYSKLLPFGFFIVLLVLVGFPVYMTMRFFVSDLLFQQSLVAAAQNKGVDTYKLQIASIQVFPYRDVYYRAFSQTNLALANSLALSQQNEKEPNAEVQKNIVTLIQQSINAGRNATNVAPFTAFNWNNLSSIYRSIIGFGQNADRFTLLTLQQAIALDPNNPQQYVDLGGVYYQLGQYDEAMRYFQVAITLKNNYANAYYNLGHAYEAKGELDKALPIYEQVKAIVQSQNDQKNVEKIDSEIAALQKKMAGEKEEQTQKPAPTPSGTPEADQDLNVNEPAATLPERNPKVKVPAPTVSPLPSPKTQVSPAANQQQQVTPALEQ